MEKQPKVSWIIPVYNAAPFLGKAIQSVIDQTFRDWELIIVDDCSTDESPEIAVRFASEDERIRIIRTEAPSGSAIYPRNQGIRAARADLVAPLDADDFVDSDYLQNLIAAMDKRKADIVYPTMYPSTDNYRHPLSHPEPRLYGEGFPGRECVKMTLCGWNIHCNGGLIRRRLYLDIFNRFSETMRHPTADELLTRFLLYRAEKVAMTQDVYYYRLHEGQKIKHGNSRRFDYHINDRALIDFCHEKFGRESEEYRFAQLQAWQGIAATLEDLNSNSFTKEVKEYALSQVEATEKKLDMEVLRGSLGAISRFLPGLPRRIQSSILRLRGLKRMVPEPAKKGVRKLKRKACGITRDWRLYLDSRRISRGELSVLEPDRRLDRELYTGNPLRRRNRISKKGSSESATGNLKEGVVCIFDGSMYHGGLTDRLRGVLTAYREARRAGRPFYIMWDYPLRLIDYLEPAEVDWRMEREELSRRREETFMVTADDLNERQSLIRIRAALGSTARQIHLYTNADSARGEYKELYRELFRPTRKLESETRRHLEALGNTYWSASFRFLGRLGDFNDWFGEKLPAEERERLIERAKEGLRGILRKLPAGCRLLVTSDSPGFLKIASDIDPRIYVVEGDVKHIDIDGGDKGEVWLKTFVDQQLIMGAKKVFRMMNPYTYPTGFPRFAAEVGGSEFIDMEF